MRSPACLRLLLPLFLVACHNGLDLPGGTDEPGSCASAKDAKSCEAMSGCQVDACGCPNQPSQFVACLPASAHWDGCDCNDTASCASALDAPSCSAIPGCLVQAGCCGGFGSCYPTGTTPAPLVCDDGCDTQVSCSALFDEASCEARSDCHALYEETNECACVAAWCCATFSACATGPTTCEPPAGVPQPTPLMTCGGAYTDSYDPQGDIDGCTRVSACPK